MTAMRMIGAMIAGTAIVVVVARRPEHDRQPAPHERPVEAPWLTPEAAAQVIGADGGLGALFDGVELGGLPPTASTRARIAEFARANHVAIDLEVVDSKLAAIRFDVSFGGCCGYEGADVLALRLQRPSTGHCCVCGGDKWIDDWATATDGGVHVRARVRVNHVSVRWERTATVSEVIERADALMGAAIDREKWIEVESGRHYRVELPFPSRRSDLSMNVLAERGHVTEVSFAFEDHGESAEAMRARWGRPRIHGDTWTWQLRDRTISVESPDDEPRIIIRSRARTT
jgi:hypothetical protein